MKTIRIMLSMLLAVMTYSSMAQGIIIYKSNGTQEKLPYIAIDSIIPYFADKEPEPVEARAVDLGLPSGTLWASHNIGATAPEKHGGYYAFGETEEKLTYSWSTYMCTSAAACATSDDPLYADRLLTYTDKIGSSYFGLNCNIAGSKYDVATQTWGDSWMIPTSEQFTELQNNCSVAKVTINEVECIELTGPNGNSLIFPIAGGYKNNTQLNSDSKLYLWSADVNIVLPKSAAVAVSVGSYGVGVNPYGVGDRNCGLQIRAVKKP